MSKKPRNKPYTLPPRTGPKKDVTGAAIVVKCFPDSRPASITAPFTVPAKPTAKPPTPGVFDGWLAYFLNFVGAKLEKLNGLQFNLDVLPASAAKDMTDALADLADELKGPTSTDAQQLRWPLCGWYTFVWNKTDANAIGFDTFTMNLDFENEPDYHMVVNCSFALDVTDLTNVGRPTSSSSSYLATSSSA